MIYPIRIRLYFLACLLWFSSTGNALEPIEDRQSTLWLEPEILDIQRAGIGKSITDISFSRLHGGDDSLYKVTGDRATVIFVRDPECPVSKRYGPRSAALARWYEDKGIRFLFIYLNNDLGVDALLQDAKSLRTNGVLVGQGSFLLADQLQVVSTGDAFLLDADKKLVYRGAIDDQYGFGYTKDAPTHNYLRNAMDSLLQGKPIEIPATDAPGCVIDADPAKDKLFPNIPFDTKMS